MSENLSPAERATQLDEAGYCILCEEPRDHRKRGLCQMHYERLRIAKMKMTEAGATPEQVLQFLEQLVMDGKLLPNQQGKRGVVDDVFAPAATEFLKGLTDTGEEAHTNKVPAQSRKSVLDRASANLKKAPKKKPKP